MRTFFGFISCLLVIMFAFWAYRENYQTQEALSRLKNIQRQIASERESISVLNAEWAYLNRPSRLRILTDEFFEELQLIPLSPKHFGDASMVHYSDLAVTQTSKVEVEQ